MMKKIILGFMLIFLVIDHGQSSTVVEVGLEELLGTSFKLQPLGTTKRKKHLNSNTKKETDSVLDSSLLSKDTTAALSLNLPPTPTKKSASHFEKISDKSVADQIARYKEFLKDPRRTPGPFDPPEFKQEPQNVSIETKDEELNAEMRMQAVPEIKQAEPILSYIPQLPPGESKEWQIALAGLIGQLQDCPLSNWAPKDKKDEILYRIKIAVTDDGQTSRTYLEAASGQHKTCVDSVLSQLKLPPKKDRKVSEIVLPLSFYKEEI